MTEIRDEREEHLDAPLREPQKAVIMFGNGAFARIEDISDWKKNEKGEQIKKLVLTIDENFKVRQSLGPEEAEQVKQSKILLAYINWNYVKRIAEEPYPLYISMKDMYERDTPLSGWYADAKTMLADAKRMVFNIQNQKEEMQIYYEELLKKSKSFEEFSNAISEKVASLMLPKIVGYIQNLVMQGK